MRANRRCQPASVLHQPQQGTHQVPDCRCTPQRRPEQRAVRHALAQRRVAGDAALRRTAVARVLQDTVVAVLQHAAHVQDAAHVAAHVAAVVHRARKRQQHSLAAAAVADGASGLLQPAGCSVHHASCSPAGRHASARPLRCVVGPRAVQAAGRAARRCSAAAGGQRFCLRVQDVCVFSVGRRTAPVSRV